MSEINANITVSPIELTVTPTDNQITITPADITLGIYTAGQGTPGAAGTQGQLQFNNLGVLAGAANTQVTANGNVRFQNIGNLKINGGANSYFLQTDGTGNLTWAQGTANVSGNGTAAGANTQIQISDGTGNFTSGPGFTFDNASNIFTVPGNAYAYNFIGTLANGNSNITMATANGNIEFYVNGNTSTKIIDNQLITSNLKLTSNNITLGANAGGISQGPFGIAIGAEAGANLQAFTAIALGVGAGGYNQGESAIAIGQDAGNTDQGIKSVAIGYGAGLNSIGDYTIAIGHRAGSNTTSNNSIILNAANADFQGPLSNAFYVNPVRNANTANVLYYNAATGEISFDLINNANSSNFAAYAGNVTVSSQPNITSLGTLINLSVSGNISGANANLGNLVIANYFSGNGSLLTGINASNIAGNVANANYATYAGTVLTNAQPNITSVGTLTDLRIQNSFIHLGEDAGLNSQGGNAIAIGGAAGKTSQGANSISIGTLAGFGTQLSNSISIGTSAGTNAQGTTSIAIGRSAGYNSQRNSAVAIGGFAGYNTQGFEAIAIGYVAGEINQGFNGIGIGRSAGQDTQGAYAIGIGYAAGATSQGANSISIGSNSGATSQGVNSIAIGNNSGVTSQGANSIAIGANAGYTSQSNNTIILNASGANLNSTQANSLFVKPIRNVTGNAAFTVQLYYNPTTGEIGYK